MKTKLLLLAFVCGLSVNAIAQLKLKGIVVNNKNQAVSNVNVRLEKTTIGTATDEKGRFELNAPEGEYILRASRLDYETVREKIGESRIDLVLRLTESVLNLNEVVVTGTGTHRKLKDSPVAIEAITQKELKNAAFPSFENAMIALEPSLTFSPNAMGPYMQLNGLSNRYILVLVDGKKLGGDINGNTDLARINMSNVKRIEILKGAASSLYGSEAIAGVINIITEKRKEKTYITSNTRYGEYGQFTQGANIDLNFGIFGSSTSYQRNQSDGWQLSNVTLDKNGELVHTDAQTSQRFQSNILSQRFTVSPTEKLSLYAEGSLYDKKFKRPKTVTDYNMLYEDYTAGLGGRYLLKKNGCLSLDMNTDNFDYSQIYINENKAHKVGDESLVRRQQYYHANLKGVFGMGKFNKLSVGAEYRLDYLKHVDVTGGEKDVYNTALYAQDEIRLLNNRLQIVPGVRYVYHETFKNRLTPKISAMYSLDNMNFRASYAAGFRAPDLKQLYYYSEGKTTITFGNTDLKPESSDYYSAGIEYYSHNFTVSVNGYLNEVKNIIEKESIPREPGDPAYITKRDKYVNRDKARIRGVDFSFEYYMGAGLSAGGGYAYVKAKNLETGADLQRISRHTGNVNVNWAKDWGTVKSNFNINGRLQSKRYFSDEWARAYQLWNFTSRHTLKSFHGIVFEPGFGIENIFNFVDDKPYGSSYATLSPGRTVFVSLSVKFSN